MDFGLAERHLQTEDKDQKPKPNLQSAIGNLKLLRKVYREACALAQLRGNRDFAAMQQGKMFY